MTELLPRDKEIIPCPQECEGILLGYKDTFSRSFPLILVIGREPNTNKQIVNCLDTYDFREGSGCGFWNTSYGMVARIVELGTRQVKDKCEKLSASPILYADSLPKGILTATKNKQQQRKNITKEEKQIHIANLFAFEAIRQRVRIIITSGLNSSTFDFSKKEIDRHGQALGISVCHVPFFYGTNAKEIQLKLSEQDKFTIHGVWQDIVATSVIEQPTDAVV